MGRGRAKSASSAAVRRRSVVAVAKTPAPSVEDDDPSEVVDTTSENDKKAGKELQQQRQKVKKTVKTSTAEEPTTEVPAKTKAASSKVKPTEVSRNMKLLAGFAMMACALIVVTNFAKQLNAELDARVWWMPSFARGAAAQFVILWYTFKIPYMIVSFSMHTEPNS
jgi:hypothetical protein